MSQSRGTVRLVSRGDTSTSRHERPGFAARTRSKKAVMMPRKQRIAWFAWPAFMSTRQIDSSWWSAKPGELEGGEGSWGAGGFMKGTASSAWKLDAISRFVALG